jgi:chaperonin GroEL
VKEIESAKSDDAFVVERYKERVARLKSGVGVIKVGAATEIELKERKYRIEDAINAVKAAIDKQDGGILPGGGAALAKVTSIECKTVAAAIRMPLYRIAQNAGVKPDEVLTKVSALSASEGYNAKTDTYVDMFTEGIIDPYKVTVTALINAASVAGTVLTTEVIISPEVDPRP